ncbi:hypothetical protein TSAR_010663, partial [Trichomalopsis sarcophagae]
RCQTKFFFSIFFGYGIHADKTISKTLNFSTNTKLISKETHPASVIEYIKSNQFDFSMNSVQISDLRGIPGISYLHKTTHLLIKQYGYYDAIVPYNLFLSISALLVIIIIIKVSLRLLRCESQFASTYNISMIIFGLSTVFSAELLEYVINISINQKQYYLFNTFQDVIDSGIHLTMESDSYYIVDSMLYKTGALNYMNITVIQECVDMRTEDDTVNSCISDSIMMDEIIQKYSKPYSGWIISELKSGLFPLLVTRFFLENNSPYANTFCAIIQRLVESGIPIFWLESRLRMFALQNNDTTLFVSSGSRLANINMDENQIIDNVGQPLMIRLISVLVVGHMFATLIFFIENIIKKMQIYKYNYWYKKDAYVSLDRRNWIDHVVDRMVNDLKVQHTTLITSSPKETSPVTSLIMRKMMAVFKSRVVKPTKNSKKMLSLILKVYIMFLDTCTNFDGHRRSVEKNLKFLRSPTNLAGVRPDILIFFINRNNTFDIRLFFKEIWSELHYLYITIIELIIQASCKKLLNTSMHKTQMTIFVHQYNPFNDSYEVVDLFKNRNLFNEKLRDMHGYVLKASHNKIHNGFLPIKDFYEEKDVRRNSFSQSFSGTEYMLMKTIAQTLNFSMNTKLISKETHPVTIMKDLESNQLDLSMNSVQSGDLSGIPAISYLHETSHLLIKQYGYYNAIVPWNLFISISAVLVIIIIIKVSLRLLRSESQFASSYNIIIILFGLSTPIDAQNLRERIIYASMFVTSMVFSSELLEYVINLSISQKHYYVFNTFQDVIDSGIHLTMESDSYSIVDSMAYKTEALNYMNITVIPYKQECVDMMTEDDTVNACISDSIMVDEIIQKYSKSHSGWIISKLKSGLFPLLVPRFFLENNSPYANTFCAIIQRLVESGIPIFWLESRLRMFALQNNDTTLFVSSGSRLANINMDENQIIDNVGQPLMIRLICVLVVGHMIATLIFFIENIIKKMQIYKYK